MLYSNDWAEKGGEVETTGGGGEEERGGEGQQSLWGVPVGGSAPSYFIRLLRFGQIYPGNPSIRPSRFRLATVKTQHPFHPNPPPIHSIHRALEHVGPSVARLDNTGPWRVLPVMPDWTRFPTQSGKKDAQCCQIGQHWARRVLPVLPDWTRLGGKSGPIWQHWSGPTPGRLEPMPFKDQVPLIWGPSRGGLQWSVEPTPECSVMKTRSPHPRS